MHAADGQNLLKYYRTGAALTQGEFAEAMGLPFRTYQDLENGKATIRQIHLHAAYWALINLASKSDKRIGFLPLELKQVVTEAAKAPLGTSNPPT